MPELDSSSRPIAAVAFDLDGTLVDSRRDIADAANYALRESGRPELSIDEIASYVGDGAKRLLARATRLGDRDPALGPLVSAFIDYYSAHATVHTRPMPDALGLLGRLALEFPLALVTNKPRQTTDVVIAGLGLGGFFKIAVAGGDLPERKPHPLPLLHVAESLGVSVAEVVMVGDGPQDIECGRRAGARTVAVLGGFSSRERLLAAEPDALIESLAELERALAGFRQATSK